MKIFIRLSFLFLVLAVFMTSCTMEKRVYRPGFHVDWNKNENNVKPDIAQQNVIPVAQTNEINTITETEQPVVADVVNETPAVTEVSVTPNSVKKIDNTVQKLSSSKMIKSNNRSFLNIGNKTGLLAPFAERSGGDNQIIALLLCIFLGGFGVHSFYLGNKKKGIWQLVMLLVGILTSFIIIGYLILAALSIWILIDLIRIIIGDLGPGW